MTFKEFTKKAGVDKASLKKFFTKEEGQSDGLKKFLDLIENRIDDGVESAFDKAHVYYAIDKAYDSPLAQVTPTLLRELGSGEHDDASVLNMLKSWRLNELDGIWADDLLPDGSIKRGADGKAVKKLNIPAMFQVLPAIVKAYVTIRTARIFNERNLVPLLKYEPLKFTRENRTKCEVLTDRVNVIATQYGFPSILRQLILQTLSYGTALMFPAEAWDKARGWNGEKDDALVREGMRFHLPHPTRMFWDNYHRLSTINTDTGCEYAGYWKIRRFSDIADVGYWNTDRIVIGGSDPINDHAWYFKQAYPCTLSFPDISSRKTGVADNDRENKVEYYDRGTDADAAVFSVTMFAKVVPKAYGISKHDQPVWLRLEVANGRTVIMAEAHPSCPIVYCGYDTDENRDVQSSLALEVMPFSDQIANHLSQFLLSVRQNLMKVVFYDPNIVSKQDIEKVKNLGFKHATTITFVGHDSKENKYIDTQAKDAFHSVNFPQHNTIEIINAIRTLLDIMERVLVMSAQEVAQTASHEQTAEEVRNVAGATSQRLQYTASFIDDGIYAWKNVLYRHLMAFGEDNFYADISTNPKIDEAMLKKLGLHYVDDEPDNGEPMEKRRVKAEGKKAITMLEGFASTRDASNRIDSPQIANAMVQLFGNIAANPLVLQTPSLINLANSIFEMAGLPREFRLQAQEGGPQQPQQVPPEIEQALQTVAKEVGDRFAAHEQQVGQGFEQVGQQLQQLGAGLTQMAEALAQNDALDQEQQQALQTVIASVQELATMTMPQPPPVAPPPAPIEQMPGFVPA